MGANARAIDLSDRDRRQGADEDERPRAVRGDDSPLSVVAEARANGEPDPLEDTSWVLENEKALRQAVVKARSAVVYQPFEIPRIMIETARGPLPLAFRIRGLSEPELEVCAKHAAVPTGRRLAGGGKETKRNDGMYQRELVVAATHPEDRQRLWNSSSLKTEIGAAGDTDTVRLLLLPGEIARVGVEIAALSGFLPDADEVSKSAD